MHIGVIGVGRIGSMHAHNAALAPRTSRIALYDPIAGRAEEVAREIEDAYDYESVPTLLADVDAVLITTPTPSHADFVHAALDAGVPVLCEKPITADVEEMRTVIEHSMRVTTPVVVGFQRRFDPAITLLKERITNGDVGSGQALSTGSDARSPFISLEVGGHDTRDNAYTGFQDRYSVAYRREIEVFLDVVEGTSVNPSPAKDSLQSLVLAEACNESLRSGRPVAIDPIQMTWHAEPLR